MFLTCRKFSILKSLITAVRLIVLSLTFNHSDNKDASLNKDEKSSKVFVISRISCFKVLPITFSFAFIYFLLRTFLISSSLAIINTFIFANSIKLEFINPKTSSAFNLFDKRSRSSKQNNILSKFTFSKLFSMFEISLVRFAIALSP